VPQSHVICAMPVLFSSKTYDVNLIQTKVLRKHMEQACGWCSSRVFKDR